MKDTDEMVHTVPYTGELYKCVNRINLGFIYVCMSKVFYMIMLWLFTNKLKVLTMQDGSKIHMTQKL